MGGGRGGGGGGGVRNWRWTKARTSNGSGIEQVWPARHPPWYSYLRLQQPLRHLEAKWPTSRVSYRK